MDENEEKPTPIEPAPAAEIAEPPTEEAPILPPQEVRAILEALIFAAHQPITSREIGQVLGGVAKEAWEAALVEMRADYARDGRGLQLVDVAGGLQITTRPEYNDWVRELLDPKTPTRLSIQALETLAVIAYKQPVTLPEVIELRGVKSGGVLKTLLEKRLIRITGRKEVVGRPMLYGTTKEFLLHFGLKDLAELPKLTELKELLQHEPEAELWDVGPDGKLIEKHPEDFVKNPSAELLDAQAKDSELASEDESAKTGESDENGDEEEFDDEEDDEDDEEDEEEEDDDDDDEKD